MRLTELAELADRQHSNHDLMEVTEVQCPHCDAKPGRECHTGPPAYVERKPHRGRSRRLERANSRVPDTVRDQVRALWVLDPTLARQIEMELEWLAPEVAAAKLTERLDSI